MWTLSSSMADKCFGVFNVILIVGAAAVLIGTIGTVIIAGVREQFSDLRISSNEAEARRAVADSDVAKQGAEEARANAATANERAATLEKEAAQLRLALEAAKEETARIHAGVASRHVSTAQRALIAATIAGKNLMISVQTWAGGDPEVNAYRDELAAAFVLGASVTIGDNTATPPLVGLLLLDFPAKENSVAANALAAAQIVFEYRRSEVPHPILRVGIKRPTL